MLTKVFLFSLFSRYSPLFWVLLTGFAIYSAGYSGLIGLAGIIVFFFAVIMFAISFGSYLRKRGAEG